MDEWGNDAYAVIYDEQDRERTPKSSSVSSGCCGGLFVFVVIGLILTVLI